MNDLGRASVGFSEHDQLLRMDGALKSLGLLREIPARTLARNRIESEGPLK